MAGVDHRHQIGSETVRGLLLMNGGGAIALLAFLPDAWDTHPHLAGYLIAGLAVMALGVVLAALVNPARNHSSLTFAKKRSRRNRQFWFWAWRILVFASILMFAVAVGIVVVGGYITLAREDV